LLFDRFAILELKKEDVEVEVDGSVNLFSNKHIFNAMYYLTALKQIKKLDVLRICELDKVRK